jgi:tRNA-splicing endonuclease subunit Sen15, fungi type
MSGRKDHVDELVASVLENLEYQHDWTSLQIHTQAGTTRLPRPLISGLPPRRLYLHPDDQIEMIKAHSVQTTKEPIVEWVLPTHLEEKFSVKSFAEIFDAMEMPATLDRPKRLLLATIHDDSTIVYYFIHDGIVKPRQN